MRLYIDARYAYTQIITRSELGAYRSFAKQKEMLSNFSQGIGQSHLSILLTAALMLNNNRCVSGAEVAEWKTRRSQKPLGAIPCRFESDLRHHAPRIPYSVIARLRSLAPPTQRHRRGWGA